MLVLTRRRNQVVRIGDDISITVVTLDDGKVRLGITAPPWVGVHRQEVYERIRVEGEHRPRDPH